MTVLCESNPQYHMAALLIASNEHPMNICLKIGVTRTVLKALEVDGEFKAYTEYLKNGGNVPDFMSKESNLLLAALHQKDRVTRAEKGETPNDVLFPTGIDGEPTGGATGHVGNDAIKRIKQEGDVEGVEYSISVVGK